MREFSGDDDRPPKPDDSGSPRFGRLLIVLLVSVLLIVLITIGSEAYYS